MNEDIQENNDLMVKKFNWQDFSARMSILSTCLAFLAISIGSPIYLGSKIDGLRSDVYKEMKDFHGSLVRIDIESKLRMEDLTKIQIKIEKLEEKK